MTWEVYGPFEGGKSVPPTAEDRELMEAIAALLQKSWPSDQTTDSEENPNQGEPREP